MSLNWMTTEFALTPMQMFVSANGPLKIAFIKLRFLWHSFWLKHCYDFLLKNTLSSYTKKCLFFFFFFTEASWKKIKQLLNVLPSNLLRNLLIISK